MTDKPSAFFAGKETRIAALKLRADELGLMTYAGLYGDKRCKETWLKLLETAPELQPLHPRVIEKSSQFNWKLAIALFIGAVAFLCLPKPLYSKGLPVKITIELGRK